MALLPQQPCQCRDRQPASAQRTFALDRFALLARIAQDIGED